MFDRDRTALAFLATMDDKAINTISGLKLSTDVIEEFCERLRSNINETYRNGFVKPDDVDEAITTVVDLIVPEDTDEILRHFGHIGAALDLTPGDIIYNTAHKIECLLANAVESILRAGVGALFDHIEAHVNAAAPS